MTHIYAACPLGRTPFSMTHSAALPPHKSNAQASAVGTSQNNTRTTKNKKTETIAARTSSRYYYHRCRSHNTKNTQIPIIPAYNKEKLFSTLDFLSYIGGKKQAQQKTGSLCVTAVQQKHIPLLSPSLSLDPPFHALLTHFPSSLTSSWLLHSTGPPPPRWSLAHSTTARWSA